MNTAITKNADGSYNAVIFSSDNKRGLILPVTALQQLYQQLELPGVYCYYAPAAIGDLKYSLDKFYTLYPEDTAAKVLALEVKHKGDFITEVIAKIELSGPKKKAIQSLLNSGVKLGVDIRSICGAATVAKKNAPHNVIRSVVGLYFVPIVESEQADETKLLAA